MTDKDESPRRPREHAPAPAGGPARAPKLSVALITYKQEDYIGPCLQSILDQVVDFDLEVVVGEDCSPDGTLDVVRAFQDRHPGVIRVLHDRNHGITANFARTILACTGEYVALAEGDDLWLDPRKLQLQADYLDQHPDCALCYHDVEVLAEQSGEKRGFYGTIAGPRPAERTTLLDLVRANYISTCSSVFRRASVSRFPDGFSAMRIGDYPLFLMIAEHGWLGFVDRVMSMYRVHDRNAWANADYVYRIEGTIAALENVAPLLQPRNADLIRRRVFWWNYEAAGVLTTRGDDAGARVYAERCARQLQEHDLGVPQDVVLAVHALAL